jgi:hypothetical protein
LQKCKSFFVFADFSCKRIHVWSNIRKTVSRSDVIGIQAF